MKKVIPFSKTVHFKTMIAEVTDIEVKHTLKATDNQTIEGDILVDGTYKMTEASQIEEVFHYTLPFTIEVDDKYDIREADIGIHDFYFEIINEEDLKVNVELEISRVKEKEKTSSDETSDTEEIELFEDNDEIKKEKEEGVPLKEGKFDSDNQIENKEQSVEILERDFLEEGKNETALLKTDTEDAFSSPKEELDIDYEENSNIESNTNLQNVSKKVITLENTPMTLEETKENEVDSNSQSTEVVPSIFSSISQEETFVTYYVYIVREQDTVDSILEKYHATRESVSAYNDLSQIKVGSKIIIPCSHE